ncbi:MAG: mandelate racemase [Rhodospirillaceae bacterium]
MSAPKLRVLEVVRRERPVTLRMPFRFGVVTLRAAPQAFVRVRVRMEDGRESWGRAAEMIVPKWFDKDPVLSNDDNLDQLRAAVAVYAEAIRANGAATAFGHYAQLHRPHIDACARQGLNPLVAGFGPALVDRAVLDALCRADGMSIAAALGANRAGMAPDQLLPEFRGFDFDAFLASLTPLDAVHARHTVGLTDPLTAADVAPGAAVGDGLPETLEEVASVYGHAYYKIKVGADRAADLDRLEAIAAVLDRRAEPYHVTLDGNEQYDDIDGIVALVDAMQGRDALARFNRSILFVEQPIRRAEALERDVDALARTLPVIIDESDADLYAFARARARGYAGVSSKSCKGFYKSLINLARCRMWNAEADGARFFLSAEDLTCQAGIDVQQDLALVALLGIGHVERNGHHYVAGMAGASDAEQARFLAAHPDLYHRVGGRVTLKIADGRLAVGSLQSTGYGGDVEPDWDNMDEMKTAA